VIRIIKTTQLSEAELSEISELITQSEAIDGFSTHFYVNSMVNRGNGAITDYLLYSDNQLAACVSFFMFGDNFVEICALTHPSYRKKGYFTRLFGEAQIELSLLQLDYCIFCCPKESVYAKKLLKRYQAVYQSSESNMAIDREAYFDLYSADLTNPAPIQIKKAKKSDAETLARLGAEAFKSSYSEELARIMVILEEPCRSAFLAFPENNLLKEPLKNPIGPIGKVHLIKNNQIVLLHDFCVLVENKDKDKDKNKNKTNNTLAAEFLKLVLAAAFQVRTKPAQQVKTLVGSNEIIEMKLYKNLGFQVVSTMEYWRCNLLPSDTAYPSLAIH